MSERFTRLKQNPLVGTLFSWENSLLIIFLFISTLINKDFDKRNKNWTLHSVCSIEVKGFRFIEQLTYFFAVLTNLMNPLRLLTTTLQFRMLLTKNKYVNLNGWTEGDAIVLFAESRNPHRIRRYTTKYSILCRTKQKVRLVHKKVSVSRWPVFFLTRYRVFSWFIAKFAVCTRIAISLVTSVDWTKVTMKSMLKTTMMQFDILLKWV